MIIKTKQKSPRKLSFMSIYFLGINGIIGSEIFLLPQAIYKDMDLAGVLVLLFSAVTVILIALLVFLVLHGSILIMLLAVLGALR